MVLEKSLLRKIDYVLGSEPEGTKPPLEKTNESHEIRKRCRIFLGHWVTKAENNNMKHPTQQCQACVECVCDDHSICVCDDSNQ